MNRYLNNYPLVRQEKESWSLPVCLHSIIKLRRPFEPEPFQAEIVRSLRIDSECTGNLCDRIGKFLGQYNLRCRHENPYTNKKGYDLLLEGELNCKTDVIVAYDYKRFENIPGKPEKRFSIILRYFPLRKTIVTKIPIIGKDAGMEILDLERILTSINPGEDEEYGFYIIDG